MFLTTSSYRRYVASNLLWTPDIHAIFLTHDIMRDWRLVLNDAFPLRYRQYGDQSRETKILTHRKEAGRAGAAPYNDLADARAPLAPPLPLFLLRVSCCLSGHISLIHYPPLLKFGSRRCPSTPSTCASTWQPVRHSSLDQTLHHMPLLPLSNQLSPQICRTLASPPRHGLEDVSLGLRYRVRNQLPGKILETFGHIGQGKWRREIWSRRRSSPTLGRSGRRLVGWERRV